MWKQQTLSLTLFVVLTGGVAACERQSPEPVPPQSAEAEPVPLDEALVQVARDELAEAISDPDPFVRARRLGILLPAMGPEAVPAIRELMKDHSIDLTGADIDLLVRAWAGHAPEEAATWARRRSPRDLRPGAVYSALHRWAEDDPQTAASVAMEWGLDEPLLERVVPIAIVRGWHGGEDPPELRTFIAHLPPGILRQRAIRAYIRITGQSQGGDVVGRWAEALPDENKGYKLAVYRHVATELTLVDLAQGLAWCEKHCDGPFGKNMRSRIARTWLGPDGPAAMEWITHSPESPTKALDIRVTYARWVRIDREAAMAWAVAQAAEGSPPWLQSILPVYARALAMKSPEEAIPWAERIEDERARTPILMAIARVWRARDEAAADQWLEGSTLSQDERDKVRGTFAPPPEPAEPADLGEDLSDEE